MTNASPVVRRSVFARTPLLRRPWTRTVGTGGPYWRWARRLLLALLALLLLLAALVGCHENRKPADLATSILDGRRLAAGPVCIEEAVDLSGSMTKYVPQRERAERALFTFARRELGPQDLLSETFFAGSAKLAIPPTPMHQLTSPPPADGSDLDDGTLLAPAVGSLVAARSLRPVSCAVRALVMITDGEIFDDPQTIDDALGKANYARLFAVVPAGITGVRRANLNGGLLDSVTVYGFNEDGGLSGRAASIIGNVKPLDVIFGEILGSLTGQQLVKTDKSLPPVAAGPTRGVSA